MKDKTKGSRTVRCHAYVRVSTQRQADLEHGSLDAQTDEIRQYLKSSWPAATLVDETGWRPRGLPTDAADHWYAKSDLKSGVGA